MGADLHIRSISDELRKKYGDKFDEWVQKRNKASELAKALEQIGQDASEEKRQAKNAQRRVTYYYDKMYERGYFRDSYNPTNVAYQLDFSWWQDIVPMLDKEGLLSVEKCKEFLAMIKDKNIPPATHLNLGEFAKVDDGENSLEKWREYFVEKKQHLIEFLQTAIALNEPISCSL